MSENNDDTLLDDLPDDVEYDIANEDEDALLADDEVDEPTVQYLQGGVGDTTDQEEYQEYEEPLEDVLELGVTEDLLDSEIQDSADGSASVQEASISHSSMLQDSYGDVSTSRVLIRPAQEAVVVTHAGPGLEGSTVAGESEEEDDKHGEQRNRFKSERTNIVSLKSNKSYGNIPDSLDRVVTTEDSGRQKFTTRKEGGWRGRRGRGRGAAGRQVFHQVQPQFQSHQGFQQAHHPQKILINPHFRGVPQHQVPGSGLMPGWEGERVPPPLLPQQQFNLPPPAGQFPVSPQHFDQPGFYQHHPPQPQHHQSSHIYVEQSLLPQWQEQVVLHPPPLHNPPPPPQHFAQPPPAAPYDQSHQLPQSGSWDADVSAHIVVSQPPQYTQQPPQQVFRQQLEAPPAMQYRHPDMFSTPPPPPQHQQRRPRFQGIPHVQGLRTRNVALRPQGNRQAQPAFRPQHKRLPFDKTQRFELPAKRKKRMPDMSNLHEVQTVDTLPDTTVSETPQQEEMEDEETREYRKKIEEQKRLREKILQQKEERRKKAALQKQLQLQQQQVNVAPGEPPQGNAIVTIVNRNPVPPNPVPPAQSQPVAQRLGGWGRGRGRGKFGRPQQPPLQQQQQQQHQVSPVAPAPSPIQQQQRPKLFTVRTKTGELKQVWGTVVQSQTGQRVVRCVPQQVMQQRRIVVGQQTPAPSPVTPTTRQVVAGRGRTVILRGTDSPAQPLNQRIVIQKGTQAGVGGTRVVLPKKMPEEGTVPQQVLPRTKVVSIDNLAASTSEAQLRKMCQRVGAVESLQMYSPQRRAVVTFANPAAAATFFKRQLHRGGFSRSFQDPAHCHTAGKLRRRIVILK